MKKTYLALAAGALMVVGTSQIASADYIDTTGPTGSYYQYSSFAAASSAYKGGGDVDTYGNTIYVNRDGSNLDVYTVSLADTDGDGAYEPDQHPDNIGPDGIDGTADDAKGPMEARTLTYKTTYSVPALDGATVGEIYAASDRVYFLGDNEGDVYQYVFGSGITNKVVDSGTFNLSQLGYDDVNNTWYASNESSRTVYSWNGSSWVNEFSYVSLAGSHMDGLEVVTDPDTGTPYVYVSDMTSDYIGQWRYDTASSSWVEQNLFQYNDLLGGAAVEGMGFGALGHFLATTGFSSS